MKKIIILLKAVLTRDMSLYSTKGLSKKKDSDYKTIPIIMSVMVIFSVAVFSLILGVYLKRVDKTYIMLSLFIALFSISLYIEGILKSQDILFVAKDNTLLLSLPITDKMLLLVRLLKLLIFQHLYNLLFISPVIVIYILLEYPGPLFYIMSLIYIILMPIIPTILASINGYLIKWLTSKFKAKKTTQLILSFLSTFIFFIILSNFKFSNIIDDATRINNTITKFYYPIKAYLSLINHFDLLIFIKLLLFNIIPLIIFIYLGSIFYFKIITKSNETGRVIKKFKMKKLKKHSILPSLVKKELINYITTPMYSYNTLLGLATMFFTTIYVCINKDNILNANISVLTRNDILYYLPKLYCIVILLVSSTLTISASSISLEGRSFNLLKSLPIDIKQFINSKLLASTIISSSILLLSSIIFIISFKIYNIDALLIILYSIIVPFFISTIGLILNFRYPKLEYANVSEVVKQSLSIIVAEIIGIGIFIISTDYLFINILNIYHGFKIEIICFFLLSLILYIILIKYGTKKYYEINL